MRNKRRVTKSKQEQQLDRLRTDYRVALVELERLAYFFGPGADLAFNNQVRECRRLRDELFWAETNSGAS